MNCRLSLVLPVTGNHWYPTWLLTTSYWWQLTFDVYITTVDNTPQSPGKEVHSLCTSTATSKNLVFVIEHVLKTEVVKLRSVSLIAGSDR